MSGWQTEANDICNKAADEIERLRAERDALRDANTKLVGALDMIRETLDGGEVQDLRLIINNALRANRNAMQPTRKTTQEVSGDIWSGLV